MNTKQFLPLPNKKLPNKRVNSVLPPVQHSTNTLHSKPPQTITSMHFQKPTPKKLPMLTKKRQSFQYSSPSKIKPGFGQTITPPPSRFIVKTEPNTTKLPHPQTNEFPQRIHQPPHKPSTAITSIKEMNKKQNTSPKKPTQPKQEAYDDFGISESLSPGVEDLLESIESSQTVKTTTTLPKSQSESNIVENNEKRSSPRKTKSLGPTELVQSPPIISTSMEEETSSELDLVLLLEENQRLKKQISARATQAAEITFLRNQIKEFQRKEIEHKKITTELNSKIPKLVDEKTEKLKSEVLQLTSKLNFKDDEIQKSEHRQEILNSKLTEDQRIINSLKHQLNTMKKQGKTNIPPPQPLVPQKIKIEQENIGDWSITNFAHRERKWIPVKKIGPAICSLMELIGEKKFSQIQRTKSFGPSQGMLSQGRYSQISASQSLQRSSSLSELGTPALSTYSKELEEIYKQISLGGVPCHHLFPALERLCHTKDECVVERILSIVLVLLDNCEDCRTDILGNTPKGNLAPSSVVIIPSSCEESQAKLLEQRKGESTKRVNDSDEFTQHKYFQNERILFAPLGKRKREVGDSGVCESPPVKKYRKTLFDSASSLSQPSNSTLLDQLKGDVLEFCQSKPKLLRPLIQIFVVLAKACPTEQLYFHFEGLFTRQYLNSFLSDCSIEIQGYSLDLLYSLLSNSNLLELTRVSVKGSKSVLDRVVQLLWGIQTNIHDDSVRYVRKRSVRILSLLVCLFADGTSEPLHDKVEYIINNDHFLSRLIIMLHSEIEFVCTPCSSPTTECLSLIREGVQLLSLVCTNPCSFHSVRHLFTSAMNHLASENIHPSVKDLAAVARALMGRCFPTRRNS